MSTTELSTIRAPEDDGEVFGVVARRMELLYVFVVLGLIPTASSPWSLAAVGFVSLVGNVALTRIERDARESSALRIGANSVLLTFALVACGPSGHAWLLGLPLVVGVSALTPSRWRSERPEVSGYRLAFITSAAVAVAQVALGAPLGVAAAGFAGCVFVGGLSVRIVGGYRTKHQTLQRSNEFANRAITALEQENRLSVAGVVAANIAHQVNNPLTYATLTLDLLREHLQDLHPGDEESAEYLSSLESAVAQVTDSVKHFRELVVREGVRTPTLLSVDDLMREVSNVVCHCHPDIEVRLEGTPGLMVIGDRRGLLRALLNLMNHFIEAMPQELRESFGGRVVVDSSHVEGRVLIKARSNGISIPEFDRSRMFDLFAAGSEGKGSRGFGLAIARALVRAEDGLVTCIESPESEVVFQVDLPLPPERAVVENPSRSAATLQAIDAFSSVANGNSSVVTAGQRAAVE